jgi:hypothetical protein
MTVQAFNLTGYFEHRKFEALNGHPENPPEQNGNVEQDLAKLGDLIKDVAAAQQSLSSQQGGTVIPVNPPSYKFYKDANLLIVIGSPEAVETARKIVNALPGEESQNAKDYDSFGPKKDAVDQTAAVERTLRKIFSVPPTNSP